MRTRYGVRKILPTDDYASTETIVGALRELLYERGPHERIDWSSLRVDAERAEILGSDRVVMYARIDVETDH